MRILLIMLFIFPASVFAKRTIDEMQARVEKINEEIVTITQEIEEGVDPTTLGFILEEYRNEKNSLLRKIEKKRLRNLSSQNKIIILK